MHLKYCSITLSKKQYTGRGESGPFFTLLGLSKKQLFISIWAWAATKETEIYSWKYQQKLSSVKEGMLN